MRSHYAMRQNVAFLSGRSSSAYVTKLITSTLKKNFLPKIFQFTKTVQWKTCTNYMMRQKLRLTTVDGKYWHDKPLMRPIFCQSNFHVTLYSATCCGMQKLYQSRTALTSTLFSAFSLWQSHILLNFAVRHSVGSQGHELNLF